MTARQVWPVSIGSYSDYRVVMACATEAEAQQVVDHLNANKPNTYDDDYDVDSPIPLWSEGDPLPQKVTVWYCATYDDGRKPTRSSSVKWQHDVWPRAHRWTHGGEAFDWPTPEEAEQQARTWMETR